MYLEGIYDIETGRQMNSKDDKLHCRARSLNYKRKNRGNEVYDLAAVNKYEL